MALYKEYGNGFENEMSYLCEHPDYMTTDTVKYNQEMHNGITFHMRIGGDESGEDSEDSEEESRSLNRDQVQLKAFLETDVGVPLEYFNPLEANSLEKSLLTNGPHKLNLLNYLRNGYVAYLKWFMDKARIIGMSKEWDEYLIFAVAHDINQHGNNANPPMGLDIELISYVHSFKEDEKDCIMLAKNYCKNITTNSVVTAENMREYLSQNPKMTMQDFCIRLKNVSKKILEEHSANIWRGTKGTLCSEDFVISLSDLESGQCKIPACGFHLGLKMLEENGYMDPIEDEDEEYKRKWNEYQNNRDFKHTKTISCTL